jgi:hypothetical protein
MACRATKYDRQINELEHGNTRKSVAGRKIDLLVQSVDGDNTFELTSVEFKPMGVSDAIQIVQQNKNLRINKSILSRLIKHVDDPSIGVIGMDVIGRFPSEIHRMLTYDRLYRFGSMYVLGQDV